jgi:hypothetical protein
MPPVPDTLPPKEGFEIAPLDGAEGLLRAWDAGFHALLLSPGVTAATRADLQAGRRITGELAGELAATLRQPGKRWLLAIRLRGAVQCVGSLQLSRRALFVEYLASAPWNLLRGADLRDPRTAHGACSALIEHGVRLSRAAGLQGRLSLEADNPHCRQIYFHLGFRRAAGEASDLIPRPALAGEASDLMLLEPATSLGWRRRTRRVPQLSAEVP